MYESFGAIVNGSSVTFRLFFPDKAVDPAQYTRGGLPRIRKLQVIGTFQVQLGNDAWDRTTAPEMVKGPHAHGWLYSFDIAHLADGFYEYKYFVEFENNTSRWCGDPCSKYDGSDAENSAFVVGGNDMQVRPLADRQPLENLILYELMIDDFTAEYRKHRAPLDAIWDRLDYFDQLGINAIEFMPWTAWPEDEFSWGYDPYAFFTVEHRYYNDPTAPLDKLFRLKRLIDELHRRNKHVIMDGVFNHVQAGQTPDRGFPYFWLYQDPTDSPFIGNFEGHKFFNDFDFANECTAEFIVDVCKYWIDEYKIDGIRFDYALGYYREASQPVGITRVIRDLNSYAVAQGLPNLSFTIELLTDNRYEAVGKTNEIQAGGCWYDQFMWDSFGIGRSGQVRTTYVRALNSGKDFDSTRRPVTYLENHDHSTLTQQCGGRGDRWWRTQPLAIALFTMCGAPLLHNGQEFGEQYLLPEDGDQRIQARPLHWDQSADNIGTQLRQFYRRLIDIRLAHPALRSQAFYPDPYDEQWTHFNPQGYGINIDLGVAIFHRWGQDSQGRIERFLIVLNFSFFDQLIDIPFSTNGRWEELLSGSSIEVQQYRLRGSRLPSNWGCIYYQASNS